MFCCVVDTFEPELLEATWAALTETGLELAMAMSGEQAMASAGLTTLIPFLCLPATAALSPNVETAFARLSAPPVPYLFPYRFGFPIRRRGDPAANGGLRSHPGPQYRIQSQYSKRRPPSS